MRKKKKADMAREVVDRLQKAGVDVKVDAEDRPKRFGIVGSRRKPLIFKKDHE